MPSLADNTRISAQETTPGHSLSTASLMVSRYLKFLSPKLLSVSFSDKDLLVESSRREASHDYTTTTHIAKTHQNQHIYLQRKKKQKVKNQMGFHFTLCIPEQHSHGRCF